MRPAWLPCMAVTPLCQGVSEHTHTSAFGSHSALPVCLPLSHPQHFPVHHCLGKLHF